MEDWSVVDLERKMAQWVTPQETCEDLLARLARTTVKLKTSLPFVDPPDAADAESGIGSGRHGSARGRHGRGAEAPDPQQRVKLRAGQVLEICGPNGTCKTECLLQAAATCVLPQSCGGCAGRVFFVDMISGTDPVRLVQILDTRIRRSLEAAKQAKTKRNRRKKGSGKSAGKAPSVSGSALLEESLKRFHLVRCYNNMELICTLKALAAEAKESADGASPEHSSGFGEGFESGGGYRLIVIDDISAFYWLEKGISGFQPTAKQRATNRDMRGKRLLDGVSYSLQNVYESIALNLQEAAQKLGSAVIVTRNLQLPAHSQKLAAFSAFEAGTRANTAGAGAGAGGVAMPKAWQKIVHYSVVLQREREHGGGGEATVYYAKWGKGIPQTDQAVRFAVRDHCLERM